MQPETHVDHGSDANLCLIATDDTWAHAAVDVDDVNQALAGLGRPVDAYDTRGRPLELVRAADGRVIELRATGEPPDLGTVTARLGRVLTFVREYAKQQGESTEMIPQLGLLTGRDLEQYYVHFAFVPPGDLTDDGSWWHNLLHKAGADPHG
jgi:hypothetical protein